MNCVLCFFRFLFPTFPFLFAFSFFYYHSLVFTFLLEIVVAVWRRILCVQEGGWGRGMSKPRLMLHRFRALLDFECLSPSVDELIFPCLRCVFGGLFILVFIFIVVILEWF